MDGDVDTNGAGVRFFLFCSVAAVNGGRVRYRASFNARGSFSPRLNFESSSKGLLYQMLNRYAHKPALLDSRYASIMVPKMTTEPVLEALRNTRGMRSGEHQG